MTKADLTERIERELRDDFGMMLSDDDLEQMYADAVRDYCIFGRGFTKELTVYGGQSDGVVALPSDYLMSVRFERVDGSEVPFVNVKALRKRGDFREHTGDILESVCVNGDGHGKLRLYPVILGEDQVGKLIYRCVKGADEVEDCDGDAIFHHVLFQVGLIYGKSTLSHHYSEFMSVVNGESVGVRRLGGVTKARYGRYY